MSKRTRGTARTPRRPGTRPPTSRPAGARPRSVRASATVEQESQLEEAAEIAEELIESPTPRQTDGRVRHGQLRQPRTRVKPGSLLAARAATEYVYVAQDIRRIVLVSGILLGIMLVLYVLLVVARVVPLPFY